MKTHLKVAEGISACGRGKRLDSNVSRVNCLLCQSKGEYDRAKREYIEAQEAAFKAQVPRTVVPQFGRVNDDGVMECPKCAGVLWRERPRSLFSYHYVCEGCGNSVHPMTETGMCT
jgi:predicted nucleic acid-binding Zn ribbon protein